jgi:hypothetical protein
VTEVLQLRGEAVTWREMDGEVVALDTGQAAYFTANATGTLLWRLLADGTTRDGLVSALCDAYGIGADVAGPDVDTFLAEVRDRGLLQA